ncbi:MAG TPA: NYN domain-containing protein [Gemmatimonadaceae bacterium]|nr:NYN domain-containing protein [Gemmatimonadaceae bacterium]
MKAAAKATGAGPYKWIDLAGLCRSYLPQLGATAALDRVHYFSALASHLGPTNPDVVRRHQVFLRALKGSGVIVELAHFKRRDRTCGACGARIKIYEEKETDVAIAVTLVELATGGACETIVLVSGDTDLAPALRAARRLAPAVRLCAVFPFGRHNRELQQLADLSFKVPEGKYAQHQFPDPLILSNGKTVRKPATW